MDSQVARGTLTAAPWRLDSVGGSSESRCHREAESSVSGPFALEGWARSRGIAQGRPWPWEIPVNPKTRFHRTLATEAEFK